MTENEAGPTIQTVTSANFGPLVLEAKVPTVVEFMSYGCSHCRAIEPVLQQVARMLESEDKIVRVNTAIDQGLAEQYEIRGTPTLIVFLHGAIVGRVEGPSPDVTSVLTAIRQPQEN